MSVTAAPTLEAYAALLADARGAAEPTPILPTPYAALRSAVPLIQLRERGTFFTGAALAQRLWAGVISSLNDESVVIDPACGAGDLLQPAHDAAREARNLGLVLRGYDIDASFVQVAETRLARPNQPLTGTKNFQVRNFLTEAPDLADATHVVLNPPFISIPVDEAWAKGSANAAALFVVRALEAMNEGAMLLAILPDVLRSGSRYARWRDAVADIAGITQIEPVGQFDKDTDVDVFIMRAIVGKPKTSPQWVPEVAAASRVGDYFQLRVGSVVPHRDPESGPKSRFVTARSLRSGERLMRRHKGRLDQGPLVLVNRTSRPGQNPRVRAYAVETSEAVAVENHLIAITPRDGITVTTSDLVRVLSDARTAAFLDERIRCRHLTVGSLSEVPWVL